MSDVDAERSELVTKFLLNSCRLGRRPNIDVVFAVQRCASWAASQPDDEPGAHRVPSTTGSFAEFYIEPMLSCIGDVDVMFHATTELATPSGYKLSMQLPADFYSYVRLHVIIDSMWPGYVYLMLCGLLFKRSDEDRYSFWQSNERLYLTNEVGDSRGNKHGPAQTEILQYKSILRRVTEDTESTDFVCCVRCLVWPPQAAEWQSRHREFGWPDSATVDRVVSNGCDVVGVAHRQCKQHEWEGIHQFRLSFSRAEIVVLNSWHQVQQLVYHMLRMFVKTERLTDSADNSGTKILSNYQIKTLMLWACELKPQVWWTDDLNCVRICTTLLHTLASWIRNSNCPQYFVSRCNLFDHDRYSDIAGSLVSKLAALSEKWLSTWFVDNYIRKCAAYCGEIAPTMELESMLPAIVDWRQKNWMKEYFIELDAAMNGIVDKLHRHSLNARSTRLWLQELTKLDQNLVPYFIGVAFLHIARSSVNSKQLCHKFSDVLATLCQYLNDSIEEQCGFPKDVMLVFKTKAIFLKLVAKKPLGTLMLIQIELSKIHLQKVLQCQNPAVRLRHDTPFCLSNVYLAALYYTTGQYQTAADHCALVTRTNDHTQSCSHVVEAELLPKIDDNIDSVLGSVALYQYVRTAATESTQQRQSMGVFDVTFFLHYLQVKSIISGLICPIEPQSTADVMRQYYKHACGLNYLFVTDLLLLKISLKRLARRHFLGSKRHEVAPTSAPLLSQLLEQSAVEQLTQFRRLMVRDYGSMLTIATSDFEALFAYKCGEYQHCLQLCRQNVGTLINAGSMSVASTYPEFLQLMDDDIVSLVGLTLTVNPAFRDDGDYLRTTYISQLTLSLYLLTQCQLKLRDSEASLYETLRYIKRAQRKHPGDRTLDHLTLRLAERKLATTAY